MSQQINNDITWCAKKIGGFSGEMPDSLACVFVSDGCSSSQRKFVKGGLKYFRLFFVALYGKRTNLHFLAGKSTISFT